MKQYLVEVYLTRAEPEGLAQAAARARGAAERAAARGVHVRYLRSIFVPEDETCFLLFEARSADAVRVATEPAALACLRIVEAIQPGAAPSQASNRGTASRSTRRPSSSIRT
jgi:hypothetical protein